MTIVKLRRPHASDAEHCAAFDIDPEIVRGYGVELAAPRPRTRKEAEEWVHQIEANPHAFVIEADGALAGEVHLFHVNPVDSWGCLAIGLIDPARLGQGIGRESVRHCLGYAFGDLGLHRVSIRVLATNTRAIRCYERCGFIVEGRERESARVGGRWEDDMLLGMLAEDFRQL
jgi:RimJ/RimL family protein N-acetyltransferase